jgi:hypothetical protein
MAAPPATRTCTLRCFESPSRRGSGIRDGRPASSVAAGAAAAPGPRTTAATATSSARHAFGRMPCACRVVDSGRPLSATGARGRRAARVPAQLPSVPCRGSGAQSSGALCSLVKRVVVLTGRLRRFDTSTGRCWWCKPSYCMNTHAFMRAKCFSPVRGSRRAAPSVWRQAATRRGCVGPPPGCIVCCDKSVAASPAAHASEAHDSDLPRLPTSENAAADVYVPAPGGAKNKSPAVPRGSLPCSCLGIRYHKAHINPLPKPFCPLGNWLCTDAFSPHRRMPTRAFQPPRL